MRRTTLFVLFVFLSVSVVTCLAQNQEYVGQYDGYFGFAYLTTPNINLAERGWQGQFGYNYRRWLALGFDTSYSGGSSSLTVPQLNNGTIGKLAPILPLLPPVTRFERLIMQIPIRLPAAHSLTIATSRM